MQTQLITKTYAYVDTKRKKEKNREEKKNFSLSGSVLRFRYPFLVRSLANKSVLASSRNSQQPSSLNQTRNMQDTSWTQFTSWQQQQSTPQQPQYMASSGAYTPSAGWGAPPVQTGWGSAEEAEYESEEEEEVEDDENEDVKCGICKNFLVEPRVLGCMHNFCTSCLQRLASKIESLSISTSHF